MKTKDFIIAVFGLLLLSSCKHTICEPDGLWDPMKWERLSKDLTYDKDSDAYMVPAEGGEYAFRCKNYRPWIGEVYIDPDTVTAYWTEDEPDFDYFHLFKGGWCSVETVNDTVKVCFESLSEGSRKALVCFTAGDIFDSFYFIQQAQTDSLNR